MAEGDAAAAARAAERLRRTSLQNGGKGAAFGPIRNAFQALLKRRGYFVDTPADLEKSILEILEIGPGFDLFDLSAALAACASDEGGDLPEWTPFLSGGRGP